MRESFSQSQTDLVSNCRNKTHHQTWGPIFSPPLCSDFTSSNVGDYNNTMGSNSHINNSNNMDATYGWTEYNNPYVNAQLPVGNTLPTYR